MRRELMLVALVSAIGLGIRVYPPLNAVIDEKGINFLENDAWYHVRLVENQVRHWPWRVTIDPYAAPGGQFVPIAPLFDTITATIVAAVYGRDADSAQVEAVAAMLPPILGTLTVLAAWALGRCAFDSDAGVLGAALLAILPGHFLDRTLLGFYDHHALEALLAVCILWALARELSDEPHRATPPFRRRWRATALLPGIALGLYLLAWASGAFLIAVLGVWIVLLLLLAGSSDDLRRASRGLVSASVVALAFVLVFQDSRMHRYGSQVLGLTALAIVSGSVWAVARRDRNTVGWIAVLLGIGAAGAALAWWLAPGLARQVLTDVARLTPDATRMAVLEARPLFLYPGNWHWQQPWEFFRTGFFVGLIALVLFSTRVVRDRRPIDLLLAVFAVAMFVATIGQNRFGYYLVPACAILGGWLASRVLHWGGMALASARETGAGGSTLLRETVALVAIAAMYAPNISRNALTPTRAGGLPAYWRDSLTWLGTHTPPPFQIGAGAADDYYLARYPRGHVPSPEYTVMNWWDHGYWLIQIAHRVPVANPTQERAPNAARFYSATNERDAAAVLAAERVRYVMADWELPFRLIPQGAVMGRFQNVLDWSGAEHAKYYAVHYRRSNDTWVPVWVFHEPYYQSMTFRLMVLGGAAVEPSNATSVLVLADRVDSTGLRFKEITSQSTYDSLDEARQAAESLAGAGQVVIAGLDPWRSAFPIEALATLREIHATRTPDQKPGESPWVRIFAVR